MAMKAFYLDTDGKLQSDLSEKDLKGACESKRGLLWVDICEATPEDSAILEGDFGFHRLAVEDCMSGRVHPPKVDDFGDHIFIIVHGINHMSESDIVETAELRLFLGSHFVVSVHDVPLYSLGSIAALVEKDARPMKRGADMLAYELIDALVENVMPTIDRMSDVAEEIEEEVLRKPQQATLESILKLKRSTLRIHRVMSPQREVLNRLSRGDFEAVGDKARIFYRDVYDHIVRIEDLNQTRRDRSDNALATHLSSIANRQNETMKVLSIVAAIFLPLTLLAGIYGMNFENMPELGWKWGYYAVLGFMGAVVVFLVWWFWFRGWIARERRRVKRFRPFEVDRDKLTGHISRVTRRYK